MTNDEKILQFQPVTIRDDMMFGTVMADPEYCRPFLETILGVRIRLYIRRGRRRSAFLSSQNQSVWTYTLKMMSIRSMMWRCRRERTGTFRRDPDIIPE